MKKHHSVTVPIKGMHCRSCELLVQDEVSKIPGVVAAQASSQKACVSLQVVGPLPSMSEIKQAVNHAGYELGVATQPWITRDHFAWLRVIGMFAFIGLVVVLLNQLGVFAFMFNSGAQPTSLSAIAILGLTAGFSTCAALVGGLLLAFSSAHAKSSQEKTSFFDRIEPTMFFQVGRVLGFMLFGGLLGLVGSSLQPTPLFTAILSGFIAIIMIWFGTQLTGLFPRLASYQLTLPSWIAQALHLLPSQQTVYSPIHAALIGTFTFFVPCGFTQVAQLYAVSTASVLDAGIVMGIFALTTIPGLTSVSLLGNFTHTSKTVVLTQFIGVVIMMMGIYSLLSAGNLLMASSSLGGKHAARMGASDSTDIQVIEMTQKSFGYFPKTFTVKKGIPVRWIIDSQDQYSCASSIVLAKYGINTTLMPGKNVFEFTPKQAGTLNFSCSMGMYTGTIKVVE